MTGKLVGFGIASAVMAGTLSFFAAFEYAAQNPTPSAKTVSSKPVPRMADGHPDFNGYYNSYNDVSKFSAPVAKKDDGEAIGQHTVTRTADGSVLLDFYGANGGNALILAESEATDQPPYKPEWMAKVNKIASTMWGGSTNLDPSQDCSPLGVPRGTLAGEAVQVIQTPQVVAILYEEAPGPYYRLIYTDGRQHPDDLDTSYLGHSVGHWDGDTLVVDTVGLNDETWLGGRGAKAKGGQGQGGTNHTSIHSDKEHVIERWTRNGDTLTVQTTVEDPVAFTKPWVLAPVSKKLGNPADYLQPQTCAPNDLGHFVPPSDKNVQTKCGYCVPEKVYGGQGDQPTAPGVRSREQNQQEGDHFQDGSTAPAPAAAPAK